MSLHMSSNDHKGNMSFNMAVPNKLQQVGEFTDTKSMNNEDNCIKIFLTLSQLRNISYAVLLNIVKYNLSEHTGHLHIFFSQFSIGYYRLNHSFPLPIFLSYAIICIKDRNEKRASIFSIFQSLPRTRNMSQWKSSVQNLVAFSQFYGALTFLSNLKIQFLVLLVTEWVHYWVQQCALQNSGPRDPLNATLFVSEI